MGFWNAALECFVYVECHDHSYSPVQAIKWGKRHNHLRLQTVAREWEKATTMIICPSWGAGECYNCLLFHTSAR